MKLLKKMLKVQLLVVVMLSLMVTAGLAQTSETSGTDLDGKPPRTIGIESRTSYTAVETTEAAAKSMGMSVAEMKVAANLNSDRNKIKDYLENSGIEYGGVYTESGKNIFLLTDKNNVNAETIKSMSSFPDQLEVKFVKYSEKELKANQEKLNELANSGLFDIEGIGIDIKLNKVDVYISPRAYEDYKEKILEYTELDMINWNVKDLVLVWYAVDAGESIGNGSGYCSVGFNGLNSNNDPITITAGHCSATGTSFSHDGSPMGTMTSWNYGSGNYDGGYIELLSGVTRGVDIRGISLTIGTSDYFGTGHQVGDSVAMAGRHGNYFGLEVVDASYISGVYDLVKTKPSGSQGGDSGGLVYSGVSKNGKGYAMIEGIILGAIFDDINGNGVVDPGEPKLYDLFSKYRNVVDGLNISAIYVDSSY